MQEPKRLGDAISEAIKQLGLQRKLDEARVIEAWHEIAGGALQEVTDSVWIDREKLIVKVNSAVWRQELHLQRKAWLDRLTEAVGKPTVKEILFR